MHRGSKNESDRGASHPGRNSWEAAQVYPRANTADQKSGGARQEPRGNCRVGRRDRWFAASQQLTKEEPEKNSVGAQKTWIAGTKRSGSAIIPAHIAWREMIADPLLF